MTGGGERNFHSPPSGNYRTFVRIVPVHVNPCRSTCERDNTYGPTTILPSVIAVTPSRDRTCSRQEISNEKSASVYRWREVAIADCLPESRRRRCDTRSRPLALARNLVLANSRIWPEGGGFPHCASQFAAKFVLILKRLCDFEFSDGHFFSDRVQQKRSR